MSDDLDKAIETDQKIFEKQMLGADAVSDSAPAASADDITSLRVEIKAAIQKLNPAEKKAMQGKLTEAGLPTAYNKETNPEILARILSIVAE